MLSTKGGFFFFGKSAKSCPRPGPSHLALPVTKLKRFRLAPEQEVAGGCQPKGGVGHAEASAWLDAAPGWGENPQPSPLPSSSLLLGVTARFPPELSEMGGCQGWLLSRAASTRRGGPLGPPRSGADL